MTATCPSCGCHQPEGLLCHDDSAALETMLAAVPQLIDQLQVAISKQARISTGGKGGKGTAREQNPINFGALAVRDALLVELALWGDDITAIRRHPQAAEIVSGIGRAVKDAYRAIDRLAERQYLGRCMGDGAADTAGCGCNCHGGNGAYPPPCNIPGGCGPHAATEPCYAEVFATLSAKKVACRECGAVHDVALRRAWLLKQAEDTLLTAKEASLLIGQVGQIRVTEASIRGYIHRKRIAYRPGGTMIRLGDLLDVVQDEGERRSA